MSKQFITVTDFFGNQFVNYASYDNLRKIASVVDGQKNGSRKILYTVLEQNINKKLKVSQLSNKVAEYADYLHGSLDGVVVTLAQDYVGTNNVPLLKKDGNFGTRYEPAASAARYIYASGTDVFFELFKKEDSPVLNHQMFEGNKIEPMFYVPSLPVLLLNGSEGVSSGFAQKILSRNPEEVKQYIVNYLAGEPTSELMPYFNNFNGTVERGENKNQYLIKGTFKKIASNKLVISEVPPWYSLKGYIKVLDDLEDKKIITSYKDKSEDDKFLFEVTMPIKNLKSLSDDSVLAKFKLVKTVTENLTCTSEQNKIIEFSDVHQLIQHYINVKLNYTELRKLSLLQRAKDSIKFNTSKYIFIECIVNDKLSINKRKKADITKDLDLIEGITKKDDSYDYLLNMNILSLTEERLIKLGNDVKVLKQELKVLNNTDPKTLWMNDL